LIGFQNTEMARGILGSSLMVQENSGTGSLAQSKVHAETAMVASQQLARLLEVELVQEQIIAPMMRVNFPNAKEEPKFKLPQPDKEQLKELTARIFQAIGHGILVEDEEWIRPALEFPPDTRTDAEKAEDEADDMEEAIVAGKEKKVGKKFASKPGGGGELQPYDENSGKYGRRVYENKPPSTGTREPWEMTSAEFEKKQARGTYGDWYMTNDGRFVRMQGNGGIGSERIQAYDIEGKFVGYYNRDDLTLAAQTSPHIGGRGNVAADAWLKDVSERSGKLKKDNETLLMQTGIYDTFKSGVEKGKISQERFLELQKAGTIMPDTEYAKGIKVQAEIDAILDTDLVVPENKQHRAIIEQAVKSGKKVPERVLAEYGLG
jgi:hypothetical protein